MTAADDKDDRDKHVWSVWRQDDNGNRFEVAVNLTRDQAEQRVQKFESHGYEHKQTYWVARSTN